MPDIQCRTRIYRPDFTTYNAANIAYSAPTYTYQPGRLYTLSIRAKILARSTFTLQARSHIIPSLNARVRILRRQGWPIVDPGEFGFAAWTDTRFYSRAYILNGITYTANELYARCRVYPIKFAGFQSQAKVVPSSSLQMRVWVLPQSVSSTCRVIFDVRQLARRSATVLFYIRGRSSTQAVQSRCRIAKTTTTSITGHFLVTGRPGAQTVVSITNPVATNVVKRSLFMRVSVVK